MKHPRGAAALADAIRATDFSGCSATVVGYGNMGRQFVAGLQQLGVKRIRVCSHPSPELERLRDKNGMTIYAAKVETLQVAPDPNELGIIALPIASLAGGAKHLASLGYRKLLIEKPVSLWSSEIEASLRSFEQQNVEAYCGYNRAAYPSLCEGLARAAEVGGITSCTYTFTEFIHKLDPSRYTRDEMTRWGIANSLHVMSMAHGFIGLPASWKAYRRGALSWHPSGAVFTGSGISQKDIPFSYHADWGSSGRWSVEIHTPGPSYRFCPLEKLLRRTTATSDWEDVPLATVAPDVKTGFLEQVAAVLSPPLRDFVGPYSLRDTLQLTRFGEDVFGYTEQR